nr:sporulation initiation phosphotransferase B [Neobacillus sp. Marseille-Q6967]
MEKEWDIIEVLRHSRHDWLNRLQLIKGNLDLNRIDRAKEYINEIVIEAQHETKLSNFSMPMFVRLLLKTNWEKHAFLLEYEVLNEFSAVKIHDGQITSWTEKFFSCLDQAVEPFQENHLSITIEPQSEGVRFFFDFSGIIKENELIEHFLKSSETKVDIKECSESELALELFMPAL